MGDLRGLLGLAAILALAFLVPLPYLLAATVMNAPASLYIARMLRLFRAGP